MLLNYYKKKMKWSLSHPSVAGQDLIEVKINSTFCSLILNFFWLLNVYYMFDRYVM